MLCVSVSPLREDVMTKPARSENQSAEPRTSPKRVRTTLGDLIAAAFDTLGNRLDVAQLLASRELSRVAGARIVLQ
jgi:hypothetical protein